MRVVVVGAGGQARELEWLLRSLASHGGNVAFAGHVISDLSRGGTYESPVLGDFTWLRSNRDRFDSLALGVGSPELRLRLSQELLCEFNESLWPALVHPDAILDRNTCYLAAGSYVGAGAILTVNVRMEAFSMANFGCTIGHESTVGRGSVVNPGANIGGGVVIGDGVLIGTGAQVLEYRSIGDAAVVGAGAVVLKDVAPNERVLGVPARPK